jgi:SNF2 family DNA or RNA helicase
VGLNLQEASRVYITAPAWNPATELQAIGRSHRTGQTRPVVVKKLLYKDASDELPSIEEAIVNLQMAKSRVCADVLGDRRLELQVPGVISMKMRTIAKFFRST